jgi:hypothetical protein
VVLLLWAWLFVLAVADFNDKLPGSLVVRAILYGIEFEMNLTKLPKASLI